jgi:hypothetical protein
MKCSKAAFGEQNKKKIYLTTMVTMFRGNQYPCRDKGYLNQQHKQLYLTTLRSQQHSSRSGRQYTRVRFFLVTIREARGFEDRAEVAVA